MEKQQRHALTQARALLPERRLAVTCTPPLEIGKHSILSLGPRTRFVDKPAATIRTVSLFLAAIPNVTTLRLVSPSRILGSSGDIIPAKRGFGNNGTEVAERPTLQNHEPAILQLSHSLRLQSRLAAKRSSAGGPGDSEAQLLASNLPR